ncbi:MAG: redox-sensitive bicupin YhaK (pirin superfamily) [Saprospiraceae bacterium]|jgi:redox-sensitive bicupin YhaK (pirin superfamily)
MNRKSFLRNSFLGIAGVATANKVKKTESESTYDRLMDRVGFNHLPNKEEIKMKSVLHKANTRGNANHGWLNSHHSFSFANYYNPERMNFGALRVLNDDQVAPARGFEKHKHDNMEIISIPLSGDLEHEDNMGNKTVIKEGDVQIMSAGTGVYHSEYNKNKDKEVKFLQIWVFPNQKNVTPSYDQITLDSASMDNKLAQIVSPNADDAGVMTHQDAYFHMGDLTSGTSVSYDVKSTGNGVYAFVLKGDVSIDGQALNERDGYGVWDMSTIKIEADSNAKVLLMEVPMNM